MLSLFLNKLKTNQQLMNTTLYKKNSWVCSFGVYENLSGTFFQNKFRTSKHLEFKTEV